MNLRIIADPLRSRSVSRVGLRGIFFEQADRSEEFRELALLLAVEGSNHVHVFAEVAARIEGWAEAADLPLVVEEAHDDRDIGFACDVIEARFPVVDVASRAFRGNCKAKLFIVFEDAGEACDYVFCLVTTNGYPAKRTHDEADRWREERVLADPRHFDLEILGEGEQVREIPIRRVWRGDHYVTRYVGSNAFRLPSRRRDKGSRKKVSYRPFRHCRRVASGETIARRAIVFVALARSDSSLSRLHSLDS